MCPATRGVRCDLPTTVDALLNYHVQGNTSLASPALWDMMGSCKTKVALGTFAGEGGRECAASSWESWSCLFRFQPPAFSLCTSPPLPPPFHAPTPRAPMCPGAAVPRYALVNADRYGYYRTTYSAQVWGGS